MADEIHVRLDLARIRKNLAAAGDLVDETALLQWLEEIGFRIQDDGWWLCEEISLDSLEQSEILERRP